MSGGVDSSVTALMLSHQGYEVIGVTMILKDAFSNDDDIYKESEDAKAVCDKIGIAHYVVDFRNKFKKNVIDYFSHEYSSGRTPNPCVRCNSTMKFGEMLQFALGLGCDAIATGHYAEIEEKNGMFFLKKTNSPKDQSYFLYTLTQYQLQHALFPLINMKKEETREIAAKYDLPVAFKSDSQDICFVKDGDYVAFLEKKCGFSQNEGNFIDQDGKVLGKHNGIYRFTVGQRKGLGIALGERKYVTKINCCDNSVCLGESDGGNTNVAYIENSNFINFEKLDDKMEVMVKTRYRAKPTKAVIKPKGDLIEIHFLETQKFICPGQSAVFYNDDYVIGGGILV